jgi:hypothetical protein
MADDPQKPSRPTSISKLLESIGDQGIKSPLGSLSDVLADAIAGKLPEQQQPGQAGREHHQPKAELHLRPPAAIAKPVDRSIDRERQAKEDRLARDINSELSARLRGKGLGKDRDPERDR